MLLDSKYVTPEVTSRQTSEDESRAKTAPSKRKYWKHDSIDLKVQEGDPVHIKAPGTCTCVYICQQKYIHIP